MTKLSRALADLKPILESAAPELRDWLKHTLQLSQTWKAETLI
jgi:hypothetical protein